MKMLNHAPLPLLNPSPLDGGMESTGTFSAEWLILLSLRHLEIHPAFVLKNLGCRE